MRLVLQTPREFLGREGQALGPSDWLLIDQARINLFAEATGDDQWIHVDAGRARAGPFGATIAQGYLTLSIVNLFLPQILEVRGFAMAVNYGCDRVRFPAAVPSGSRVRGVGEILSVQQVRDGGVQPTIRITVEIEGSERPACVADTIGRYYPEPAAASDGQAG